ncbi:hypothetical protein N2152v2_004169 [Parachlorella kessleri]
MVCSCLCTGELFEEDYYRWSDHPARQQWEVLKDLGEGAFAQVVSGGQSDQGRHGGGELTGADEMWRGDERLLQPAQQPAAGTVVLARHRETGELAALKVVFLQSPAVDPDHLKIMMREAELLPLLDHPNIVECRDVIRSPRQLVLVLEWLRGGQVIDRLHELGPQYSEQQAAELFVQVARGVAYLHEYGVLHRDIKPENVLLARVPEGAGSRRGVAGQKGARDAPVVKIVDLGMAAYYDPTNLVRGPMGSPGFVAPEIIKSGPHTPAMDVFSLGVLLFVMLVGRKPFNIKESESLQYAFLGLQDAPGFRDPRWLDLSPDAKHLLMGMLSYDPARRLSAKQVLEHEWVVSRGGRLPRPLGQDVVHGAATVATVRRLKNLCHGVAALNRATQAAAAGKKGAGDSASSRDEYVKRLRTLQKIDVSVREGANASCSGRFAAAAAAGGGGAAAPRPPRPGPVQQLAYSLAKRSYAKMHDVGQAADPALDPSASLRGRSWRGAGAAAPPRPSAPATPANSLHSRLDGSVSRSCRYRLGGLQKAGTSLMLSEMGGGMGDGSTRGGGGARGAPAKSFSMSTLGEEHSHSFHDAQQQPKPSSQSAGRDPAAGGGGGREGSVRGDSSRRGGAPGGSRRGGFPGGEGSWRGGFPGAEGSRRGSAGEGGSLRASASSSSLRLLSTSIKQYVDASLHGRRAARAVLGQHSREGSRHALGSIHSRRVSPVDADVPVRLTPEGKVVPQSSSSSGSLRYADYHPQQQQQGQGKLLDQLPERQSPQQQQQGGAQRDSLSQEEGLLPRTISLPGVHSRQASLRLPASAEDADTTTSSPTAAGVPAPGHTAHAVPAGHAPAAERDRLAAALPPGLPAHVDVAGAGSPQTYGAADQRLPPGARAEPQAAQQQTQQQAKRSTLMDEPTVRRLERLPPGRPAAEESPTSPSVVLSAAARLHQTQQLQVQQQQRLPDNLFAAEPPAAASAAQRHRSLWAPASLQQPTSHAAAASAASLLAASSQQPAAPAAAAGEPALGGSGGEECGRRHSCSFGNSQNGSVNSSHGNSNSNGREQPGVRVVRRHSLDNPLLITPVSPSGPHAYRWEDIQSMQAKQAPPAGGHPSRKVLILKPLE